MLDVEELSFLYVARHLKDLFPDTFVELSAQRNSSNKEDEQTLNNLGYYLIRLDQIEAAIEVFKSNVQKHPDSWNVYDSLGEAYMIAGQTQLAIDYYKKSLELNPDNNNAKEMLKKLEKK